MCGGKGVREISVLFLKFVLYLKLVFKKKIGLEKKSNLADDISNKNNLLSLLVHL